MEALKKKLFTKEISFIFHDTMEKGKVAKLSRDIMLLQSISKFRQGINPAALSMSLLEKIKTLYMYMTQTLFVLSLFLNMDSASLGASRSSKTSTLSPTSIYPHLSWIYNVTYFLSFCFIFVSFSNLLSQIASEANRRCLLFLSIPSHFNF